MKTWKYIGLLAVTALMIAGCDTFPGLRALSGDNSPQAQAETAVQTFDMVMADKSGNVDESLLTAADRLEAVAGNVDVVEIREDPAHDSFNVYMIANIDTSSQTAQIESIRRTLELTWLATMRESERSGLLDVKFLAPLQVTTLDNGPSFVGFTQISFEIERLEAVKYLSHPHDLNAFVNLILNGQMLIDQPQAEQYTGEPNHPIFMLPQN